MRKSFRLRPTTLLKINPFYKHFSKILLKIFTYLSLYFQGFFFLILFHFYHFYPLRVTTSENSQSREETRWEINFIFFILVLTLEQNQEQKEERVNLTKGAVFIKTQI